MDYYYTWCVPISVREICLLVFCVTMSVEKLFALTQAVHFSSQMKTWPMDLGSKLEVVTPFLGKYRPFVGRCCQRCTPKSWVSSWKVLQSLLLVIMGKGMGESVFGLAFGECQPT